MIVVSDKTNLEFLLGSEVSLDIEVREHGKNDEGLSYHKISKPNRKITIIIEDLEKIKFEKFRFLDYKTK
jgi:hypothetical protein